MIFNVRAKRSVIQENHINVSAETWQGAKRKADKLARDGKFDGVWTNREEYPPVLLSVLEVPL